MMQKVYILVNKSNMLMGVFTSIENLNMGISVLRTDEPNCRLYYQEVTTDLFDSTLIQFWTMHPEKLIEIDREKNSI